MMGILLMAEILIARSAVGVVMVEGSRSDGWWWVGGRV